MHEKVTDGQEEEDWGQVFAALPPARGQGFAMTWWGQRWLRALRDTALDGERLAEGRRLARAGAVGAVSVRQGRITAVVRGRDHTPHRADVLLQRLNPGDWERLLDAVAGQAGHIAALLDRDMPPDLVADAEAAGVELLPGVGDLEPACECGEWDHCSHTAALAYQLARLLDQDPFLLLLLRGREEHEVLAELQRRGTEQASASVSSPAPVSKDRVLAREVFARDAAGRPSLPAPPPMVPVAGAAPVLGGGAPPGPELDVAALEFLAAGAAVRAQQLLAEALSAGHATAPVAAGLSQWQDAVRLALVNPGPRLAARLARGCGRSPAELEPAARAWAFGGPTALRVLEDRSAPAAPEAVEALDHAWEEEADRPRLRGTGNRWTVIGESIQLRYGGGHWWPYRKRRGRWWPAGQSEADPAAALAAARGEEDDGLVS